MRSILFRMMCEVWWHTYWYDAPAATATFHTGHVAKFFGYDA